MKYTVWYIEDGIKKIWATGLTLESASLAVRMLILRFSFDAGMDKESRSPAGADAGEGGGAGGEAGAGVVLPAEEILTI